MPKLQFASQQEFEQFFIDMQDYIKKMLPRVYNIKDKALQTRDLITLRECELDRHPLVERTKISCMELFGSELNFNIAVDTVLSFTHEYGFCQEHVSVAMAYIFLWALANKKLSADFTCSIALPIVNGSVQDHMLLIIDAAFGSAEAPQRKKFAFDPMLGEYFEYCQNKAFSSETLSQWGRVSSPYNPLLQNLMKRQNPWIKSDTTGFYKLGGDVKLTVENFRTLINSISHVVSTFKASDLKNYYVNVGQEVLDTQEAQALRLLSENASWCDVLLTHLPQALCDKIVIKLPATRTMLSKLPSVQSWQVVCHPAKPNRPVQLFSVVKTEQEASQLVEQLMANGLFASSSSKGNNHFVTLQKSGCDGTNSSLDAIFGLASAKRAHQ